MSNNGVYLVQPEQVSSSSEEELQQFVPAAPISYNVHPYESISGYVPYSRPTMVQVEQKKPKLPKRASPRKTSEKLIYADNSSMATKIVNSKFPIEIDESELITVNDLTGIYANKSDEKDWNGIVPIRSYTVNVDSNPEIMHKNIKDVINYKQPITISYLKPPPLPPHGEIIIKQERDQQVPKAPPLVIRQKPAVQNNVQPLVIREMPPVPMPTLEKKLITVAGKMMAPPPRKLIVEKLPPMPRKPPPIVIEKWLPYERQKRQVKFIREENGPMQVGEKNLVILWDSPEAMVTREYHTLGTIVKDPDEYRRQYDGTLYTTEQLIQFVKENDLKIDINTDTSSYKYIELEGDVQALSLVDLDREGLSEYKTVLKRVNIY